MSVPHLFFFRAIPLIAFLHDIFLSFVREAVVFCMKILSEWARAVCRSRQARAPRSSRGLGLVSAGFGISPSGKGHSSTGLELALSLPLRGDMLRTLSHFTRKFPLLIRSWILRIKLQEFIFHDPNNFLFSCLSAPHHAGPFHFGAEPITPTCEKRFLWWKYKRIQASVLKKLIIFKLVA